MKLFKFNSFQKHILTLFKGQVIGQVIGVIGAMVLAKWYGPSAYGIYAVFLSFAAILSIVLNLQLDLAIVTLKSKAKSNLLASNLIQISFLLALLLTLIDLIFKPQVQNLTNLLVQLVVFVGCLQANVRILEALLTKHKGFKTIAQGKFLISAATVGLQFIFFNYSPQYGLIYGSVFATSMLFTFYLIQNRQHFRLGKLKSITFFLDTERNLWQFALPANLINTMALHLMPILLLYVFSQNEVGSYSLALKILATPLYLISASMAQVYFQKASDYFINHQKSLFKLTWDIVRFNAILFLIILLFINTLGVFILNLYFDQNWNNLSLYIVLLSFLVWCRSTFTPISHIVTITKKNQLSLWFNIYLLLINFIAIYLGYLTGDITITLIILSLFGGLGYLVQTFYFLRYCKSLTNHKGD